MSDTTYAPEVIATPIPMSKILPWAVFGGVLMIVALYFTGIAPGNEIHEFVHDGRHLLGFPCH